MTIFENWTGPDLRIGRRGLLRLAAGASAAGMVGTMPLAAARATESTPKRGGHLVVGVDNASASDKLDPAFYTSTYMYLVGFQLYNTLLEIDPGGNLIPSLAESWEPTKNDASQWRFMIRKGVQFHDGKELDAEDVVHSINHHRGETKSGGAAYLANVSDITAPDKHEVLVTLSAGDADFPYTFTGRNFCIAQKGDDFTRGIGTGAFVLKEFSPGVRTLTERNPNHWNPDRGFVDSCELLAMNDATARVAALVSGSAHIVNRIDPRVRAQLLSRQHIRMYGAPESVMYCFPMRCDIAPFDNPDLRKAMKFAVDREQMTKAIVGDTGVIGNDNPLPSWNRFFSADVPKPSYDPDRAKSLLEKSGFSGNIRLSVAETGFPGSTDAAQLLQVSARNAGINIDINRVPADGYWNDVWMKHEFCSSNWATRPTADAMLSLILGSKAPWNETFWQSETFDKLLLAARSELDEAKRKQMYHDIQVLVAEDGGELIPMFATAINAASTSIQGFDVIPGGGDMAGYRVCEKVWFA